MYLLIYRANHFYSFFAGKLPRESDTVDENGKIALDNSYQNAPVQYFGSYVHWQSPWGSLMSFFLGGGRKSC